MSPDISPETGPTASPETDAEIGELEEAFPVSYSIFAMARAHKALAGAKLAELGLFPNQELMLVKLAAQDGVSQKVLAQTLRISHVSVAKTVARMERAGFVERRTASFDRRVSLVHLTDVGRGLHERIVAAWAEVEALTTAGLSPAEREAFVAAAGVVRAALDAESVAAGPLADG